MTSTQSKPHWSDYVYVDGEPYALRFVYRWPVGSANWYANLDAYVERKVLQLERARGRG